MQEVNCIQFLRPDYMAISSSTILPTLTSGSAEHNLPWENENIEPIVEELIGFQATEKQKWQIVISFCGYLLLVALVAIIKYNDKTNEIE